MQRLYQDAKANADNITAEDRAFLEAIQDEEKRRAVIELLKGAKDERSSFVLRISPCGESLDLR